MPIEILLFFVCHWFASLFFQTFFLHRYAAHAMFRMSVRWEKAFYILTFLAQGASYLNPAAYATMHRAHHATSDTPEDPHSPRHAGSVFRMMRRTRQIYRDLVRTHLNSPFGLSPDLPQWKAFDQFADLWSVRIFWGVVYTTLYFRWMEEFWVVVLLPIHYFMGPVHGAIVNWCGHRYGYRNFELKDDSRNSVPVDLLLLGELYQNNHHRFPNRVNFAFRWFELDPVYSAVRLLHFLKVIRIQSSALAQKKVSKTAKQGTALLELGS